MADSSICPFSDLIQSDLFTFYIGEEKKPFVVHSSAIAATSEPFNALVRGGLAETESKCAELKDVEPEDFARFLEYAYRCNYTVPSWIHDESAEGVSDAPRPAARHDTPPEVKVEQSPSESFNIPEAIEDTPSFGVRQSPIANVFGQPITANGFGLVPTADESGYYSGKKKRLKKVLKKAPEEIFDKATLRSRFETRVYLLGQPTDFALKSGYQTKSNSEASQNYTPVFLAHARLYTFADMRLIDPLRKLALDKLHKTLMDFQLYTQRVGDIVELARYAYEHGPDRSETGRLNDLRQLVVEYMACEVDTVGKSKEFQTLLEEGGEFVGDFWGLVSKYLL